MNVIKNLCASILFALPFSPAFSNVALTNSRLVVNEQQLSSSIGVNNTGETPLLIQSWVSGEDTSVKAPFMVTPPLFRLESKQENTLRILQLPNQLPRDQESLFWLNVKEIPPLDKSLAGKNVLRIAINNRIKLFYRPSNLPSSIEAAPQSLTWQLNAQGTGKWRLIAHNPSPYHITFASIKFNGQSLEISGMLMPHGELSFTLKKAPGKGAQVEYRTINDYGGNSALISQLPEQTKAKESE